MNRETLITLCNCSDPAHSMSFDLLLEEEPRFFVSVQLNPLHPLWRRFYYAVSYILGRRSRFGFGHWDEGSISYESAKTLGHLLRRFISECEKHREQQSEE